MLLSYIMDCFYRLNFPDEIIKYIMEYSGVPFKKELMNKKLKKYRLIQDVLFCDFLLTDFTELNKRNIQAECRVHLHTKLNPTQCPPNPNVGIFIPNFIPYINKFFTIRSLIYWINTHIPITILADIIVFNILNDTHVMDTYDFVFNTPTNDFTIKLIQLKVNRDSYNTIRDNYNILPLFGTIMSLKFLKQNIEDGEINDNIKLIKQIINAQLLNMNKKALQNIIEYFYSEMDKRILNKTFYRW